MKSLNEEQIRSLLRDHPAVEPPPGLAEQLKAQIPEPLPSIGEPNPVIERRGWGQWLVAASLLAALGVGGLSLYLTRGSLEAPADVQLAELSAAQEDSTLEDTSSPEVATSAEDASRSSPAADSAPELRAPEGPAASEPAADLESLQETISGLRQELSRSRIPAPANAPSTKPAPQLAPSSTPAPAAKPESASQDLPSRDWEGRARTSGAASRDIQEVAPSSPSRTNSELPNPSADASVTFSNQTFSNRSVASQNERGVGLKEEAKRLERTQSLEDSDLETTFRSDKAGHTGPRDTAATSTPIEAPTAAFVEVSTDSRSTFGLDVDTGSYSLVRRQLAAGQWPAAGQVRVEEMVNYFDYGDMPPEEGDFALRADLAPAPFGSRDNTHLLRLNIRTRDVLAAERPAALLVFVVDISGSMARSSRLPLVKEALILLLQQLRSEDRVALVAYGSRGRIVLEPTADLDRLRQAIEGLRSEGATNVEEGLRLAYGIAAGHRQAGRIQRVILCSDGIANVGATTPDGLLEAVQQHAQQGVELTTVGFGMGDYNDPLMEQLADRGNGRYAYVDSLDEANRLFVENLSGTLQTLAAEARAQVVFEADEVIRYRLLGYENRAIEDHRFRDDRIDGGEIGAGHSVTVLYELELAEPLRPGGLLANLHLRYASVAQGEMIELVHPILGRDVVDGWQQAPPAWRLSSVVAAFAEGLRRGPKDRSVDFDTLLRHGQQLSPAFLGDRDVVELVALIAKAADLQGRE